MAGRSASPGVIDNVIVNFNLSIYNIKGNVKRKTYFFVFFHKNHKYKNLHIYSIFLDKPVPNGLL